MNSIFNKTSIEIMIYRINTLTPEREGIWGKMTVDQMLKHINEALIFAFGEKKVKVNFVMRLLGRMLKNKVLNSDFGRNSPTAKEFIFANKYDFENSKNELILNFRRFTERDQSIKPTVHPFWGELTHEEWNKLMWKHMDHHLKQFGV